MNQSTWTELQQIFQRAAGLDPTLQVSFLDSACAGRLELRARLDRLLAANRDSEGFLETPLAATLERMLVGSRIGSWRIVALIGSGGAGLVYRAERADGDYEQTAALKLIRPDLGDATSAQLFLAERRLLARLEHPKIARLLDGGLTAEKQPYIAMEYVDGVPIDEFCISSNLSLRDRVQLVLSVCDAIQYLHQHSVIHGDLKPANILVTADRWVKVVDFGTARLVNPAGERSDFASALRHLTPQFASPEQLSGGVVTTRSDIYSLGVILNRLIGNDPSTDADIEAIIQHCTLQNPESRYATVDQIASELESWRTGLPIAVRSHQWHYCAAKYLRRHRMLAIFTLIAVCSLVAGSLATLRQARIANQNLRTLRAVSAAILEELPGSNGAVADSRARVARLTRIVHHLDALTDSPGTAVTPELIDAYHTVADSLRELGDIEPAAAAHRSAIELARRSFLDAPIDSNRHRLGISLMRSALTLRYLGEDAQALPVLEQGLNLLRHTPPDALESGDGKTHIVALWSAAEIMAQREQFADADRFLDEAMSRSRYNPADRALRAESLARLAESARRRGDPALAEASCKEALNTNPALPIVRALCTSSLQTNSPLEELRSRTEFFKELVAQDPYNHSSKLGLWNAWYLYGRAAFSRRLHREAGSAYLASAEALRTEHARLPRNRRVTRYLASSLEGAGLAAQAAGSLSVGKAHLAEALRLREALSSSDPLNRFLAKERDTTAVHLAALEKTRR